MRKEAFAQFCEAESGRKRRERKGKETERVFEGDAIRFKREDFGAYSDLVGNFSVVVVAVLLK